MEEKRHEVDIEKLQKENRSLRTSARITSCVCLLLAVLLCVFG